MERNLQGLIFIRNFVKPYPNQSDNTYPKLASIKSNIILNGINTGTSILFPILTFPYAARVLLPDGIGTVNFLNSIVSYIVLLTSLGIPMYAVKEIARCQNDTTLRNRTVVEIIILSTILCALGYILVWGLARYIPQIHAQSALFYILSLAIVFNAVGVNWFYQGIEDFKFITVRAIIIRTLVAAALFIFVKGPSDILIYGLTVVGSTVGNNIINLIHLRKYLDWKGLSLAEMNIMKHVKPSFQVFILNLIISLYLHLNTIMLGFMAGDDAVGFFTAGNKISHIAMTLISSMSTVLLPRCSSLLKCGDTVGFASVTRKSLNFTLASSLPLCVGLMILATPVIRLFCGPEYSEAVPVLVITAPVIIFICLTSVMGIQILYPMDKVNLVILSVSGGAVVNLAINILLIPRYAATGAAVGATLAELTVLILQMIYGRRHFPFRLSELFNRNYAAATAIMGVAVYLSTMAISSDIARLVIGVSTGVIIYATVLAALKDALFAELLRSVRQKLLRKH